MKNLLRKLHIAGNQDEPLEGSKSSSGKAQEGSGSTSLRNRLSALDISSTSLTDQKPLAALSGWLNSVARHTFTPSGANPNPSQGLTGESPEDRTDSSAVSLEQSEMDVVSPSAGSVVVKIDSPVAGFVSPLGSEERKVYTPVSSTAAEEQLQALPLEEEYQLMLAMARSVKEDPEAVQIETVKQISLGSYPSHGNTLAEVVAHRYWNYNRLNYDDKVHDGFYDVDGVLSDSASEVMPSLVELQGTPVSGNNLWEVVLVNRPMDPELVNLEQKAVTLASDFRVEIIGLCRSNLVQKIADLVVQHMGGAVTDSDDLLKQWRRSSEELRSSLGSIVLPLGWLRIGLARHRALLFKVLADTVEIPCQLLKGRHYTGSDEGALNIIRLDDDREYIIDLMGAPGTLIPSDITGLFPLGAEFEIDRQRLEGYSPEYPEVAVSQPLKEAKNFHEYLADTAEDSLQVSRRENSVNNVDIDTLHHDSIGKTYMQKIEHCETDMQEVKHVERHHSEPAELIELSKFLPRAAMNRSSHSFAHWRSPSWTEGIGSPAARDMKVKNVSQYMVHAAKENPELAQKLHNVLLESGVVAPPDLFTDISPKQLQEKVAEERKIMEEKEAKKESRGNAVRSKEKSSVGPGRPPAATPKQSSEMEGNIRDRPQRLNSVEGLGERRPLETLDVSATPSPALGLAQALVAPIESPRPVTEAATLQSPNSVGPAVSPLVVAQEGIHPEVIRQVPVAAAAAATAAVVASSMVVAAAKNEEAPIITLEVPLLAAARATAAVVVATTAVVGRKLDIIETLSDARNKGRHEKILNNDNRSEEVESVVLSPVEGVLKGTDGKGVGGGDSSVEQDRASHKSSGSKTDGVLDDVAEWEILWEHILIGERIGLGSYGEVYRGEWHGTEVAVKKFLDQDISGDALEEFRSEVRIMRRLRHPNVVLFMGAVTRAPNLSIVTEFLPRGSLYKLIHRPNNQLDERRRLRMALDVARGMNYLHSSTPVIVHRDLKSPNLLVDKNWVVKVCDFGLSRMKHNTFLSSKSTAGTPEWMAPEVIRNEPSNEKCDVYSFGVILWELATLQQPWEGMNPMQVVGAVGFQHRHLDIPDDMDPFIAKMILQCWQSNPSFRPSFGEIMAALKPVQKPISTSRSPETGGRRVVMNRRL